MSSLPSTYDSDEPVLPDQVSKTLEWIISILLFLGGALVALLGFLLYAGVDRDLVRGMIERGEIVAPSLTDAELLDLSYALGWWLAVGLMVVGASLAAVGVVFIASRTRARRTSPEGETPVSTAANALIGGSVSVVTGFVPFSPVIGGGVAGYLQNHDGWAGLRAGVLAGLVASVPVAALLGFVVAGLVSAGFALVGGVVIVGIVLTLVYFVGLSALGGYVGGALIARKREESA